MKNHTLLALAFALALPTALAAQSLPVQSTETVIPERKTAEQAAIPLFPHEVHSTRSSSALEADFSPDPLHGCDPLTVTFTDQSTGNPTVWKWDVNGDGVIDGTTRNFTHTYPGPGSYTVTLTVEDGQGSTASKTKEPYIVFPAIVPQAGNDTTICSGGEVQLGFEPETGGGTPIYTWEPDTYLTDPSLPNPIATPEVTTTYIFTIQNVGGCVTRDTVTISVNELPLFPEITRSGNTLTASVVASSYVWFRDGVAIPGSNAQSYTPTANGSYSVEVMNNSGCTNMSSTFNFVLQSGASVGYGRDLAAVNLSPNPFAESTTLALDLKKPAHVNVALYDVAGKQVATLLDAQRSAGQHSVQIDGANLAPGVYVCRIMIGDQVETRNIVRVK